MLVSNISQKYNNYNYSNNQFGLMSSPTFTSTTQTAGKIIENTAGKTTKTKIFAPLTKQYNKLTDLIAHGIGKTLGYKCVRETFEKLGKSEHWRKYGLQHLIVLGSTMLSGFYVKKTLDNDKLDKDKKVTLAINQAATWLLSTVAAYTIDSKLVGSVNKVKDKFFDLNSISKESELGKQYGRGFSAARSIIVIGVVYRFIAPVLVTPLSNAIGNKILAKQKAKEQEQKQA